MPKKPNLFDKDKVYLQLAEKLHDKAELKQKIYKKLQEFYAVLKEESIATANSLFAAVKDCQPKVQVSYEDNPPFEFRITAGGDALVAVMQSNIISLQEGHHLLKHKYFDTKQPYLGQILLYNFMEDTFRFNRMNDPGYLIGRLFLNVEGQLFLEGDRQLHYAFPENQKVYATRETARLILWKALSATIDNDLMAPDYQAIQLITYEMKQNFTLTESRGRKIGFQSNWQKLD